MKILKKPRIFTGIRLFVFVIILSLPYSLFADTLTIALRDTVERFYLKGFNTPMGIFTDSDTGEIYVADSGRSEVFIFDSRGAPLFRFGKTKGVFNPVDVAVKSDHIYLSEEGKPYVEVFNYRGESIKKISPEGMPFTPGRLATDGDYNLYVVNKAEPGCIVFDSEDRFVRRIGKKGLASITGVAVDGERVYLITPFEGHAIQVYDRHGRYIMGFEGLEGRGGTLGLPSSAKVDDKGRLWLIDTLKGIVVYDRDGKELIRFGKYGASQGNLLFPVDIDFGRDNRMYIVEKERKRISIFDIIGE